MMARSMGFRPDFKGRGGKDSHRLVSPARLEELERQAQDGIDMRAAVKRLDPKHYELMRVVRVNRVESTDPDLQARSQGWLEYESDLGQALLDVQRTRGGEEAPF